VRCKATLASTRRLGRCRRALCPVLPRGARARLPAAVVPATGALSGRPLPRSRAAEFRLRGGVRRPAGARPPRAFPRALRPAARDTVSEARHVTSSRTWDLSTVQKVQRTTRKTPAHHRRPTRGPDSWDRKTYNVAMGSQRIYFFPDLCSIQVYNYVTRELVISVPPVTRECGHACEAEEGGK